jgi:hypothetical protein
MAAGRAQRCSPPVGPGFSYRIRGHLAIRATVTLGRNEL